MWRSRLAFPIQGHPIRSHPPTAWGHSIPKPTEFRVLDPSISPESVEVGNWPIPGRHWRNIGSSSIKTAAGNIRAMFGRHRPRHGRISCIGLASRKRKPTHRSNNGLGRLPTNAEMGPKQVRNKFRASFVFWGGHWCLTFQMSGKLGATPRPFADKPSGRALAEQKQQEGVHLLGQFMRWSGPESVLP